MDKQNDDDIKINVKKGDKVYFESTILQQVSDTIDYLKDESKDILKDLDENSSLNDMDLEEFGEVTVDHISDVLDEMSQLKSEIIKEEYIPEPILETTRNIKSALNRDNDYVTRAKRRLERAEKIDGFVDTYKVNLRAIELCDKAIDVDKSNSEAYYVKGLAFMNIEMYPEAIDEFVSNLAIDEENTDALYRIAECNKLEGDFEDAINIYDSILKKDENAHDAIKGKAQVYYETEDYKKADEEYRKASKIVTLDDESKEIWDICLEKIN